MLIGRMEVEKDRQVDHVLVLMLVIRLADISTDIMITVNAVDGSSSTDRLTSQGIVGDPATLFIAAPADSQQDRAGAVEAMTQAERVFHDAISSFRIDDWGLFG
jgi:HAMP domain-containing protein